MSLGKPDFQDCHQSGETGSLYFWINNMRQNSASPHPSRVCVIGLDGATFRALKPWCDAGKLPNLQKLIALGASGTLLSTIPPITAAAWTSFQTGKQPGQHGIFEFSRYIPGSYDSPVIDGSAIQAKRLWDLLNEAGKKLIAVNVPMTYPPVPVDGAMVSGLLSPDLEHACYPVTLVNEIKAVVPDYEFIFPIRSIDYLGVQEYVKRLVALAEKRAKLGVHLIQKQWDFFMLHFQATDIAQHALWVYIDPAHPGYSQTSSAERELVLSFYQRLDELLGQLLAMLDDSVLTIVMSDHGFGPAVDRFNVNEWLYKQGLLKINNVWRKQLTEMLVTMIQKLDVFKLRRRFLGPRGRAEKLQMGLTQSSLIDWKRTVAFALPGSFYARIYFNRVGREMDGIVDEETAVSLAQQMKQNLLALRHPETGQPVIKNVYLKHEIYQGNATELLPDITVEPEEGYMIATELNNSTIVRPVPAFMTGTHLRDGIVIMNGSVIQSGTTLTNAHIVDLLPTILYALNIPIPADLDGKILLDAFVDEYKQAHHATYYEPDIWHHDNMVVNSAEEEKIVEERLKSLGYLG